MKNKRFFVQHVLPFFISIAALIVLVNSPFKKAFIRYELDYKDRKWDPALHERCIRSCNDYLPNEWALRNAFHFGTPMVVIGSSEMTHFESQAIPFNFFTDKKIPCIGVGHAGNQLHSILVQLAAFHQDLDKVKLTIILSPGWFEGGATNGTPLETFLEYADEHNLYYIWYDKTIPKEIKDHIYDYVVTHFKEIDSPSSILRAIYYSRSSEKNKLLRPFYAPFTGLYEYYIGIKWNEMVENKYVDRPFEMTKLAKDTAGVTAEDIQINNWDSLYTTAVKKFSNESSNNPYAIENSYYNEYMKGKGLRVLKSTDANNNMEFNDLKMLLLLLNKFHCKPLFVMQGLNPLVYQNLNELDPILKKVKEEILKNGFEFLDLHTSDASKYVRGILNDYQHMGEAGWYKVDEKMYNYFIK